MVSFASYQPPGVYVQGTAASVVATGSLPTSTVTIVAPSRGYQLATEAIVISTTPKALTHTGVLPDGVAVNLKVSKADGTTLAETTDYVLVRGAGAADPTTIARASGSTSIANGDLVTISYSYADASYYSPKKFTDFNSVEVVYGPALVSTAPNDPSASQVSSPMSMAARVAFENGASTLICVAIEPTTSEVNLVTRFGQAFAKIATNPDCGLLVPVFSAPAGQSGTDYTASVQSLISVVRSYCVTQSAAGYGRIAFVGADTIYDDAVTPFDELAASSGSGRVVLAYPFRMKFFNTAISQTTEVGGPYLAAAYAGRLAAQAPNRGLTRLQVYSFTGIPDDLAAEMDSTFKNTLSSSGVAVTEVGRQGQLVVRDGTSTDPSDIVNQEVSVTRSMDILYRLVSDGIDAAGLIGEPITDDTTTSVKSIVAGILESAMTGQVIAGYTGLLARQQTLPNGNPTVVEVQFTYAPFLPLRFITVTFSMDLNTGIVTTTSDQAAA